MYCACKWFYIQQILSVHSWRRMNTLRVNKYIICIIYSLPTCTQCGALCQRILWSWIAVNKPPFLNPWLPLPSAPKHLSSPEEKTAKIRCWRDMRVSGIILACFYDIYGHGILLINQRSRSKTNLHRADPSTLRSPSSMCVWSISRKATLIALVLILLMFLWRRHWHKYLSHNESLKSG